MKTAITLIPFAAVIIALALAVISCAPEDPPRPSESIQSSYAVEYSKHTIEGHEYFVFYHRGGGQFTGTVHNENCPCKQK